MNATIRRQLAARKRRIGRRIQNRPGVERRQSMMDASNIHHEVAEFDYRPVACKKTYRVVVLRKRLAWEKGPPFQ